MNSSTKRLILNALMIALVFLTTRFTGIPGPIPPGYINLGDAIIIAAAVLLGKRTGLLAGALGSMLADIAFGSYIYAPVTLIVKGIEGYVAGALGHSENLEDGSGKKRIFIAALIGVIIMVIGYFVAEAYLLRVVDENLGFAAAVTNLPLNLIQALASLIVGYGFTYILIKGKIMRYIQ